MKIGFAIACVVMLVVCIIIDRGINDKINYDD